MGVATVRAARQQLLEMDLQVLRQEGLVTRAERPPLIGVLGSARVADALVVDDRTGRTDPRRCALLLAEFPETEVLGADPAHENATIFSHPPPSRAFCTAR
jgi:hypothetical protein